MEHDWFKHDSDSRNDQKILMLRATFGAEGYGVWWMILETMACDTTGYISREALGGLELGFGVAKGRLKEIFDFCIKIGLLIECEHGNYYNKRMVEHKEYRKNCAIWGSEGGKKRQESRLPQASRVEKRREEENREEKKEENIPAPFLECSTLLKTRIHEKRQSKITETTIKSWCNTVRLMIEQDHRTVEDIKTLINECHNQPPDKNGFTWAKNILSMDTLRQKWNEGKISIDMNKNFKIEDDWRSQGSYGKQN